MRNQSNINKLAAVLITLLCSASLSAGRIRQSFDFDWQFRLGETAEYQEVQLPHDWGVTLDFVQSAGRASGYLPGGIGWYRKEFTVPASYKGKRVSIVFDGIYHNASIFLNDKQVGYHQYGYTSFEVDLSSSLVYGQKNVLTVKVDRSEVSRWYTGAGIYRHAWLQVVEPVHVKMWGTYVTTPSITDREATVNVTTTVENNSDRPAKVEVIQRLLGNDGQVLQKTAVRTTLELDTLADVKQAFTISQPQRWGLDNPYRYCLETIIKKGGKTVDSYRTRFGVRTVRFDKEKGFFLNDENLKLQGMCLHHDAGCMGTAVPDRSYERRLTILKEFGTNAIRCSHNPPAPEFLDYCDSLGLLVIDEAFDKWTSGYYGKYFNESWRKDLGDMIVRDRNHPSIILWSIGNEVREAGLKTDEGVERARMMQDFVHQLEPSRLVMLAVQPNHEQKFASVTDVIGYNYVEPAMIEGKKQFPERICLVSESYPYYSAVRPDASRDYSEKNPWNYVMEHDFICGSFMWTGIDYIGESSGWPSKGWPSAPFDMCMYEKPRAAYFRAVWNKEPVLKMHVLDYNLDEDPGKDHWQAPGMVHDWTFPYSDQRVLQIRTVSNCDEVVLIDTKQKKYGPRKPGDYLNNTIVWNQPYRPGKIVAIGYRNGVEVCRDSIETSKKKAVSYALLPDKKELKADGQDLSHISLSLYDENGKPVCMDDRMVTVTVEGAGRLMGIDSGEMRRKLRFNSPTLPTYQGRCQIVVQAGRSKGALKTVVKVDGMETQVVEIKIL